MKTRLHGAMIMALALLPGGRAIEPAGRRAAVAREACTHLVFVVDTSGTMREPKSGRLTPLVLQGVLSTLAAHPEVRELQMFDAEGRGMLGPRDEWQPAGFRALLGIERVLGRYTASTVPNPTAGIAQALRTLPLPETAGVKLQICVIGEALVPQRESVLCRLDELNPADANGRRRATISAVQVAPASGRASENFQRLMSEAAQQHGGTFRRLGWAAR